MEITAEISKVFGEEMAKVFSKTISEDEMKITASSIWNQLNQKRNSWDNSTEIDKLIKERMVESLEEEVNAITSTIEFKEKMKSIATNMVTEIVDETHRKIVDEVSTRMMLLSVGHYDGSTFSTGLYSMISGVVSSMINNR